MLLIIFAALGIAALWLLGYAADAQVELVYKIIGTLIILLSYPVLWVINYFREQPKLYYEQVRRIRELENLTRPKIVIDGLIETTDPHEARDGEKARRSFYLKLHNAGTVGLQNCLAVLRSCVDEKGNATAFQDVGLHTRYQEAPGRRRGPFNLRGDQTKYILIARMDEVDNASKIKLGYEDPEYLGPDLPREGVRRLTVAVYAEEGKAACRTFRMWVGTGGFLRMEEEDGKKA